MKKFIVIFFITYIFSYANYLISNSEIVLFYDKKYNSIGNIRGDIFNKIDISNLDFKLLLDNKKIIDLGKYLIKLEKINENNSLKLSYLYESKKIEIFLLPSMIERETLYVLIESENYDVKEKLGFIIGITPQYDNKDIIYDREKELYYYDNFSFKSENYIGKVYLAKNSQIEDLSFKIVDNKDTKYRDDNMYYVIENLEKDKDPIITINFYNNYTVNKLETINNILDRETDYWINARKNYYINWKREEFNKQLDSLKIMTSRALIPNQITLNKSQENLNNKIKLYYLNAIFNKKFDINLLFEDINIRKGDNEAVVYYTFLFKYLNKTNDYIEETFFNNKIGPEVLSLLDYLEDDNGEIVNVRDNIDNYYWYYELIENIIDRKEFESEKEFIKEKRELLLEYTRKNYFYKDGLKTRKSSEESYYKNIRFITLLPKEIQLNILKNDYKKYYNRLYGLLKGPDDKEKIDLKYNLDFIIKLYENGEKKQGDILLANLETWIRKNDGYLLNLISPDKDNSSGIYGELLYLYFTANEYKEKYADGYKE